MKNSSDPEMMIEWVDFEDFHDKKILAKGSFSSIYTVYWNTGWITGWDEYNWKFLRSGAKTMILKSLNNSKNPNEDFFKEVCVFGII